MHTQGRPTAASPPARDPRLPPRPRTAASGARRHRGRFWQALALWGAVATAALLVGSGTFFVVAAPVDLVRERLVLEFRARTGRDLVIAGPTTIGLWPSFTVGLADVSVPAPEGVAQAPLVHIAAIEAEVRLWPLLRHRVEIERITVHRPEVELSVDAQGRRSWDFSLAAPEAPAARQAGAAVGGEASISAGSDRLARMAAPGDINARTRAETIAGRLSSLELRLIDGALRYRNERSAAQADLTAIDAVLATGEADAPVSLTGSLDWRGDKLAVAAEVASLKALLGGEASALTLKLSSPRLEAAFEGRMATAGGTRLDGGLTITAPDLRRLAEWAGATLPDARGYGALALSGRLQTDPHATQIADARITLGGTSARGLLALAQGTARPHLTADLEIDRLDLNAYRADRGDRAGGPHPGAAGERAEAPNEEAIDLSLLSRLDADVRLAAGAIAYKDVKLGPTRLAAALADGVLRTNVREAELYGGRGSGTVDLDASGSAPAFEARVVLEDVAAQAFLEDRAGFDGIDGKARIAMALAGQGRSERQMLESLRGTAELRVREGALVGIDIPRMIRTLKEGRIPSFERAPGDRTEFSQLSASFKIEGGSAQSSDLKLVSPAFGATGTGATDLVHRRIDYAVRAHLAPPPAAQGTAQTLAGLELPLRITGPWRSPKVTADLGGIVKNPDRVVDTAKEIGRQFKGKSIDEAVRGLLGKGTEEENASGQRAKELLKGLLR